MNIDVLYMYMGKVYNILEIFVLLVLQRRSLHQTQYVPFGSPLRREAREEKWESQRNQINSDKEPTPEKR